MARPQTRALVDWRVTSEASATLRGLYPSVRTHETGHLQVSALQTLYYECSGNRSGRPLLFLHGGPGGGTHSIYRRYFDRDAYRIVMFDQRGCGRSSPRGCIEENTTWHMVEDIEALREELGVERWVLAGGSWGSALALAYAQAHPGRVDGMVLWGIFMLRPSEIDWFYQGGASTILPEAFERFSEPIPPAERGDLVSAFHRRLCDDGDLDTAVHAAQAWSGWEASASTLRLDNERVERFESPDFAVPFSRVECHYVCNNGFFRYPNQLLDDVERIRSTRAVIVQGRYDMVCPMVTAWELHRRWPEAEFEVVPDAGHSASEPAMIDALVRAADHFRDL